MITSISLFILAVDTFILLDSVYRQDHQVRLFKYVNICWEFTCWEFTCKMGVEYIFPALTFSPSRNVEIVLGVIHLFKT